MYFAERFRDAMRDGGRALFVGIGPDQLPPEYRDNPRLLCWDSDSPHVTNQRFVTLPTRTRVVVMTRFQSHATADKVIRAAKRERALFFGQLTGTGEIAKMLREAMPVAAVDTVPPRVSTNGNGNGNGHGHSHHHDAPAPPVPTPTQDEPAPASFKTLTACVAWYARTELRRPVREGLTKASPLPAEYYEKLAAQVQAHGFDTDAHRVRAIYGNQRFMLRRQRVASAAPPPPAPSAPVEAAPPVVETAPAPASVAALPPDLDALVHMADDLELKGIAATELADQLRRLVAEQSTLRGYRDKFEALRGMLNA